MGNEEHQTLYSIDPVFRSVRLDKSTKGELGREETGSGFTKYLSHKRKFHLAN